MLSRVEISKAALLQNIAAIRAAAGAAQVLAVVKSDGYGHDLLAVAKIVEPHADWFGVAGLHEATALVRAGIKKKLLVLNYYPLDPTVLGEAARADVRLCVYTPRQVAALAAAAEGAKRAIRLHVEIDTGLSRGGIMEAGLADFIRGLRRASGRLIVEGIYSHFADSETNPTFTQRQLKSFTSALRQAYSAADRNKLIEHIACSAAMVLHPSSRHSLVRAGLLLYGLHPSSATHGKIEVQPVLSWKTQIIQVKELPAGTPVGYGLTYMTKRRTHLALLPVGYADGYPRNLSNISSVLIRGKRCRVIGRVSMNVMVADVTATGAAEGEEAVLIGRQGAVAVTADQLAEQAKTINYEIVTRINWQIPRVVV